MSEARRKINGEWHSNAGSGRTDPPDSAADPAGFLLELLGMARLQSEIAQLHLESGDTVALRYALRRLTAYVRAIDDFVTNAE